MKTSEMIAMLENNPKLRFRRKGWESDYITGENADYYSIRFHKDWEIVRTPVPWQEGIQARLDGKGVIIKNCTGCPLPTVDCNFSAGSKSKVCLPSLNADWYIDE